MNVLDIRPSCSAECSADTAAYRAMATGQLTPAIAADLLPDRTMLATVWRYLAASGVPAIQESPICLCRKIVRWSGKPMGLSQLSICLDVFRDVGLLEIQRLHKHLTIRLTPGSEKADLTTSATMQLLLRVKES